MAVLKRVFGSALILLTAVFFVSGCSKSDIDTVKESFFAEDKTQNIGKFLETYKNVSGGKWKTIKDDRSRDVVVFYGNYSNKEVAKIFLNGNINYQEVIDFIVDEFNLTTHNGVKKVTVIEDNSKHYLCYLDNGWVPAK